MRQIADSGSVYIFTVAIRSGVYGVPRSCDILREALKKHKPSADGHGYVHGHDGDWTIGKGADRMTTGDWRTCSCCIRSLVAQRAATRQHRGKSVVRV